MKALFLCESTGDIFRVFAPETCDALQRLTAIEKTIYTKAEVARMGEYMLEECRAYCAGENTR